MRETDAKDRAFEFMAIANTCVEPRKFNRVSKFDFVRCVGPAEAYPNFIVLAKGVESNVHIDGFWLDERK